MSSEIWRISPHTETLFPAYFAEVADTIIRIMYTADYMGIEDLVGQAIIVKAKANINRPPMHEKAF